MNLKRFDEYICNVDIIDVIYFKVIIFFKKYLKKEIVYNRYEKYDNIKIFHLCYFHSKYMNIWWNSEKFDWEDCSDYLCKYCSDYINIWWNPDKFNWEYSNYLCMYCSKYINIWWNFKKFKWDYLDYLQEYCQDYKHIWEKDYIKWKLKNI